jgi:hypothetical protein
MHNKAKTVPIQTDTQALTSQLDLHCTKQNRNSPAILMGNIKSRIGRINKEVVDNYYLSPEGRSYSFE